MEVIVREMLSHRDNDPAHLPSQNANGVIAPAPQDRLSRPTPFMDCEYMSHSVHMAAGFDVAEVWPRFAGKWATGGVDVRHTCESRR